MSLATTLPVPASPAIDLRTGFPTREWYLYWAQPPIQATNITGAVSVAQGGTGLTGGVTGGVLAFTGPETLTSSETLGLGQIVFGGGAGAVPSTPLGTGTTTQFLQGNVKGYPTWATFVAGQNMAIEYVNGAVRFSANLSATSIKGIDSISITGNLSSGNVQVSLVNDNATPGNTYYYGTGPSGALGYNTIASALAVASTARLTDTVGSNGVSTFDLATIADSGAGALLAITRDAYGRVSGTKAATITGTATRVTVANGNASAGLPTIDLATTAVATGNYGDGTHVATFTVDAYGRLTAAGSVAIAFPAAPVTSVFGRTGAVVAAANDYAYNQINGLIIPQGYIDGLQMVWNSATSISVTSGTAYIPSLGNVLASTSTLTLSGLLLTASTWYHVYLYSNAGVPAIECVATAPMLYNGTAASKTGDNSRRYVGSLLTDSSSNIVQFYVDSAGPSVKFLWVVPNNTAPWRLIAGGSAVTPTNVNASAVIPANVAQAVIVSVIFILLAGNDMQVALGPALIAGNTNSGQFCAELNNPGATTYNPRFPSSEIILNGNVFQYMLANFGTAGGTVNIDARGFVISR